MESLSGQLSQVAVLKGAYDTAHAGYVKYRDKLSLLEKYKALDALARIGEAPGQVKPPTDWDPNREANKLIDRLAEIDYPEPRQFIEHRIKQEGFNLTNWSYLSFTRLSATVEEFERRVRELEKDKSKLNRRGERKAELPPPKKKETTKRKDNMSLLGKLSKPIANESTGEIVAAPPSSQATTVMAQNGNDDLQRALDILEFDGLPAVATREHVDALLRQRALLINEYAFIYKQYREIIDGLESKLNAWETAVKPLIDLWDAANPPTSGKTQKLLYGTFGRRDQSESLSMDYESESDRMKWIGQLSPKDKVRFQVERREIYSCNWDAIKKDWLETEPKERKPIPGTVYKEPRKNVFYVSPSLDTVKNNVREGKWEPKRT